MNMNPQCDCKTHESPAKILNLDGQVISIGSLKLEDRPGLGSFSPTAEYQLPQLLDKTSCQEVVAEILGDNPHRHRLLRWHFCATVEGQPPMKLAPCSDYFVPDNHFHFRCDV